MLSAHHVKRSLYIYIYMGGQRLELLCWASSPIYQQECVRGGENVWKGPMVGGRTEKCS